MNHPATPQEIEFLLWDMPVLLFSIFAIFFACGVIKQNRWKAKERARIHEIVNRPINKSYYSEDALSGGEIKCYDQNNT